jgi:hypothetical protein
MALAASTSGQALSAALTTGENEARKARLNTPAITFFIVVILSYWLMGLATGAPFRA